MKPFFLSYHFAKASEWNKARRYFALAGDQAGKIVGDSEALAHYKKAFSAHEEIFADQLDDFDKAVYNRKLGEIYFRRGEHDHTRAYASFCRAVHLDYTGQWDQALEQYINAAALFENIGHIKKWGSTNSLIAFILHYRGEFEKSLDYARKLKKIGVESGDRQLQGWGLGAKFEEGLIWFEMGRCLDDIDSLKNAGSIFETIHAKAELSRVDAQIAVVEKGLLTVDHGKRAFK
jgi:tetratricopeptide (TPR) repeat protein